MFRGFLDQLSVSWKLFRDPRVPLWTKAIPLLAVLYIISPIDFLPDVIPGLGQLDDIGILLAAMRLMETAAPGYVVDEFRGRITPRRITQPIVDRIKR